MNESAPPRRFGVVGVARALNQFSSSKTDPASHSWLGFILTAMLPIILGVYTMSVMDELAAEPFTQTSRTGVLTEPVEMDIICEAMAGCYLSPTFSVPVGSGRSCYDGGEPMCIFVPFKSSVKVTMCHSASVDDGLWVVWQSQRMTLAEEEAVIASGQLVKRTVPAARQLGSDVPGGVGDDPAGGLGGGVPGGVDTDTTWSPGNMAGLNAGSESSWSPAQMDDFDAGTGSSWQHYEEMGSEAPMAMTGTLDMPTDSSMWSADDDQAMGYVIEDWAAQAAAAEAGIDSQTRYVDINAYTTRDNVGVSIRSTLLAVQSTDGEPDRLLRIVDAAPIAGGRHSVTRFTSKLQRVRPFSGTQYTHLSASGFLRLTADKLSRVTLDEINDSYRVVRCLSRVLGAVNDTLHAHMPAKMAVEPVQANLGPGVPPFKQAVVEVLTGESSTWKRAQVVLSGAKSDVNIVEKDATAVMGVVGGFLSLVTSIGLIAVQVWLAMYQSCHNKQQAKDKPGPSLVQPPPVEPSTQTLNPVQQHGWQPVVPGVQPVPGAAAHAAPQEADWRR